MPCHSFHIVIITPQLFLTHSSPNMCLHILLLYEARQSAIQTLYVCAHLYLEIFENVFYIFQKCISRKARFSLRSQIFPFVRLEKRIWLGGPQFQTSEFHFQTWFRLHYKYLSNNISFCKTFPVPVNPLQSKHL